MTRSKRLYRSTQGNTLKVIPGMAGLKLFPLLLDNGELNLEKTVPARHLYADYFHLFDQDGLPSLKRNYEAWHQHFIQLVMGTSGFSLIEVNQQPVGLSWFYDYQYRDNKLESVAINGFICRGVPPEYTQKVLKNMFALAFNYIKPEKVLITVTETNRAAKLALLKVGMTESARVPNWKTKEGKSVAGITFCLLKPKEEPPYV